MAATIRPDATFLPAKHLPGTDGARDVSITAFALGLRLIPEVVAANEVGVLAGPPGTSKTFTMLTACETIGVPVTYIEPQVSQKVRAIQTALLDALAIGFHPNAPSRELDRLLITTLASGPRVIVVDEAGRLGRDGLEQLRYLHCQPSARWSLFLVGSDLETMLRRNPALDSRVARRVLFRPLPTARSVTFARRYHPLFEEAAPSLLATIERFADGNLRIWARVLEKCQQLLRAGDHPLALTPAIVAAALGAVRGIEA